MAEQDPLSQQFNGATEPERTDNPHGAPMPQPPPQAAADADQVLETPAEAQRRAAQDKRLHEDEEAGAAVAATGLGCLSLALLPWSIGIVVLVAVLLIWLFHGGGH